MTIQEFIDLLYQVQLNTRNVIVIIFMIFNIFILIESVLKKDVSLLSILGIFAGFYMLIN